MGVRAVVTVVRVVCVMTAVVMTDAGRGAQVIYLPDSAPPGPVRALGGAGSPFDMEKLREMLAIRRLRRCRNRSRMIRVSR